MPFVMSVGSAGGAGGAGGASGGGGVGVGPAGPPGKPGQPRFTGLGAPPGYLPGAEADDVYLDLASGQLYKYATSTATTGF